jgi:hypothetical protein
MATSDEIGRFGEALWARVFEGSGMNYIPLHRMNGQGAPMAQGRSKMILPDFDVAGEEFTAFVDSKAKHQSVLFRRLSEVRHGIDRSNWEHYRRIAVQYKKSCGLGIVELFNHMEQWSGSLLIESLANLGEPIRGFSTENHMVYWPRKRFVDLDSWSAIDLHRIARGQKVVSYECELTHIFHPPPTQQTLFA